MTDPIAAIDAAIEEHKAEIAEHNREIQRLKKARATLTSNNGRRRRRTHSTGEPRTTARRAAGPGAINAVSEVLAKAGRTTQAEITKATGKNSGTVSHALNHLAEQGLAQKTDRKHRGSPEWAWVGEAGRVAA